MIIRTILIALLTLLPAIPVLQATETVGPPGGAPAATRQTANVMLDGRVLFSIREKVLSFPPEERAKAISERLARLSEDSALHIDAITVADAETSSEIVVGDRVLMTVTDKDAAAEGRPRQETAREYAGKIREAVANYRREYSAHSILKGVLFTLAATVVLIVGLVLITRLFPRLYVRIESWSGTKIRAIRFQSLELIHSERISATLVGMAKGLRIILVFALFYFYIPLVLGFFPWTREYSATAFDYILAPFTAIGQAIMAYLPNIFFVLAIIFITWFALKFIRFLFDELEKGTLNLHGFYRDWAQPTFKIVRFLVIAFAVMLAYPHLPGANTTAFKGVSIFFGLIISLGSTSAMANVIAGVILIYMRGFKIGDRIKIGETFGDVVEKTLLMTRINTIKNVDITIPNSLILGSQMINYSSQAQAYGLILHTSITIGYDVPWRKVHELMITAAGATEHVLPLPAPFVYQTSLDDFYVTYQLNVYTEIPSKMAAIYSELHQNIQDKFNEAGVEIMSPHYTRLRDGNRVTIPEEYLPKGYEPSALRIYQTGMAVGKKAVPSDS